MELDLAPSPPPVEDILAARRAKRQVILAKYSGVVSVNTSISPSPGPSSAAQPPTTHSLPVSNRVSVSPAPDFALAKDSEQEGQSRPENAGGEQVSAADYDLSLDRREDEYKCLGDKANVGTVEEEVEEEEDVEDMFAVANPDKKVKKVKKIIVSSAPHWYGFPI
jgi:serine/threonine-protein kinase PRP4